MGIGAVLGVAGGLIQADSAKSAARAQERAAQSDMEFQRETRDLIFDRLDPWYQGGNLAQQALMYEMGLGDAPMVGGTAPRITTVVIPGTAGSPVPVNPSGGSNPFSISGGGAGGAAGTPARTTYRVGGQTFDTMEAAQAWANANRRGGRAYGGFEASPGYQFRLDSGNDSINALAGARGGLMSGRTLQDLATFNQGMASDEYGNYFARLSGLAGQGLSAASGQATAAGNAAQGVSNALAGMGNAQAAGAVGVGNAINSGIQNGLGMWQYQRALAQQNQGGWLTTPTTPNSWW